eukprot:scaffold380_cov332-Pavlova_lutheri.AAC.3
MSIAHVSFRLASMVDSPDTRTRGDEGLVGGGLLTPSRWIFFSLVLNEPRPAWEARTDVLEHPGGVSCRVGRSLWRRHIAHLAWQVVEEVYHIAKRDLGSTSLPLTCGWNWGNWGVVAALVPSPSYI